MRLPALAVAVALAGCALPAAAPSLPYMQRDAALLELASTGAGKISHVVYIVQENRSFDNLFQGYPGADTVSRGKDFKGRTVPLKPVPLSQQYELDHSGKAMFTDCNGTGKLFGTKCRMNGFDRELHSNGPKGIRYPMYVYVLHKDSKPYFDMAHEGVLADRMFPSQLDESFVAHQYIIAAQAQSTVDIPWGAWGCSGGTGDTVQTIKPSRRYGAYIVPCFDYETLGDELDSAKLTWRFYAGSYGNRSNGDGGEWSGYQAVKHIYYGRDWKTKVISPNWKFITDVRAGKLANFTWVTPVCDDSDHVNCPGGYGPSWVAALVDTVGKSKFWNATAIFVQWDDWGGLYDHVPPPFADYDGLGFRVPLLIISPYAKQNYVSHVQYETASVLRFAEDLLRPGPAGGGRPARELSRRRLFRLFTAAAALREHRGALAAEVLHARQPRRLLRPRLRIAMTMQSHPRVVAALLLATCSPAGCSNGSQPALPYMQSGIAMRALDGTGAGKITHVIYIVQENRSFDNLFQGYPGADTVSSGRTSKGEVITLRPVSLADQYDIDHSAQAMFAACHGVGTMPGTECRMDGFNNEQSFNGPQYPQYVYVPHKESKPYFDMAHEWVVADRMFQSQLDESFVAHQYVIAAQADSSVNVPTADWGCQGEKNDLVYTITTGRNPRGRQRAPCFNYQTLGDELDKAKLSWRFYASRYGSRSSGQGSFWSSYQAVKHIYRGPDWKNVISPNWKFITDVRGGTLANFTWITPVCEDSDHVNCGGGYGPSWVAALVNTVGRSKFWKSTAIFVQWDDWGGLYDHVPPPYLGYDSVGFRVPLLVISPYARQNYVSHAQYETASVLRFAEDLFGLGQLAAADRRATSPAADCFDFSQPPRDFTRVRAPLPPKFFEHELNDDYFAPDYQ